MDDISKKVLEAMLARSGKAMGARLMSLKVKPKAVMVESEGPTETKLEGGVEEPGEMDESDGMSPDDKKMLMELYSKYC